MGREIDVQPVRTIDFLDYPSRGFIGNDPLGRLINVSNPSSARSGGGGRLHGP